MANKRKFASQKLLKLIGNHGRTSRSASPSAAGFYGIEISEASIN